MSATATKTRREYACARCARKLKQGRWIYSAATGSRYCWPGEGCGKKL